MGAAVRDLHLETGGVGQGAQSVGRRQYWCAIRRHGDADRHRGGGLFRRPHHRERRPHHPEGGITAMWEYASTIVTIASFILTAGGMLVAVTWRLSQTEIAL